MEQSIRSLLRRLSEAPPPGRYLLGLLLGLVMIIYLLYSVKRGYLIERRWETITYISSKQDPLSFWPLVIFCLLIGGLVVVVCAIALWEWGKEL